MEPNIFEELISYFGTQELTAKALGVSQSTVNAYLNNRWGMSHKVAIQAQKATKGKFKAVDLCPSLKELAELNLQAK
ncbi:YdaS family helix-turn-helix protein [Acinetobacter radioresistens]|uniref:YdaS family helix-turn-helix protein n=1 Tax=Acinetobacter radioresistens TaxID=40216 RepID=UPI003213B497